MKSALVVLLALLAAGIGAAAAPELLSSYNLRLLNQALINAVAVVGLCFAFGYAGLIHLGQSAFMGFGAYLSAVATVRYGIDPLLAVPAAVLLGIAASVLVGWPLLRLRGHYLALATMGLVVTFEIIVKNWVGVTGGYDGMSGIPPVVLFGRRFADDADFLILSAGVLALVLLLGIALRHSRFGRAMISVRDDELAAAASGIDVFRTKMLAFVLCGALGALSGALYAHHAGYIAPNDFDLTRSLAVLAMLIVGGEFSFVGAVVGSVVVTFAPEWLRVLGSAYMAVFSILLLLVLIFMPHGVVGDLPRLVRRWRRHV
jgi:branched-chain amino acid transport system permease protein